MGTNYFKVLVAVTTVVLLTSVPAYAAGITTVRYESGKIAWIDVPQGELGLSRATPNGMKTTAYRITDNNTRVTDPSDTEFLNITDLWVGEEVNMEVIDGQEGEIIQKIIIGSTSTYKQHQRSYTEVQAMDLSNGTMVSLVGPRGITGPAGSTGEQGFAGAKGEPGVALQGNRGKQGPAGPKGEQGLTGPRGPAGDIARGAAGAAGPTGAKGQQGEAGKMGKQGDSLAGYTGPQGDVGPQGERGAVGNAGAKGPTLYGPSGAVGSAGPKGKQGIAGAQGSQGSTTAGVAGLAGSAGASGASGKQGDAGYQGAAGQVNQWVAYKEFNFNSNETRLSKDDMKMVDEIAAYMKKNPSLQIGIDGTAVKTRDQALNDRRVHTIRAALMDAGMPSKNIMVGEIGAADIRREGRIPVFFVTATDSLSKN